MEQIVLLVFVEQLRMSDYLAETKPTSKFTW